DSPSLLRAVQHHRRGARVIGGDRHRQPLARVRGRGHALPFRSDRHRSRARAGLRVAAAGGLPRNLLVSQAAATAVAIERLERRHAQKTVVLLETLGVSMFGIRSKRLYDVLVGDAVAQRIDCRIASHSDQVCGVVLAAPRAYWTSALLAHWG